MIKTSHYLFALLCLGSIFVCSQQFTDSYIVPKWCFVVFVLLVASMYEAVNAIFYRRDEQAKMIVSDYGYIIVFACFLQALLGIIQYFGLFQASSIHKVLGSFDNPAGFAVCLCAAFPFIAFLLLNKNKCIRYCGWLISIVFALAVVLSQSRAGIVSIGFVSFMVLQRRIFNKKRWVGYLFLTVFVFLLSVCYWLKKDSADGRLLIWSSSVNMIKDAPWFGHSIGSFEAHYMDYQADYLKQFEGTRYSLLADNVKQPFNEYIGVLLNFGIFGLCLLFAIIALLVYCYKKKPCIDKQIAGYSLISIGIFSLFSYPFTYPFTWIITVLCIYILTKEYLTKILAYSKIKYAVCTLAILGSLGGMYILVERIKAEKDWGKASVLALCGTYDQAFPIYERLKKTFYDNPYFLYNYAAILLENKQYKESLQTALHCRKYWADYDLELIIGENYQELGKQELAEKYYHSASMMCPSRFLPLYKLYHLYKDNAERESMLSMANLIIDKPMKIKTSTIQMMKREMMREKARLLNE